MSRLLIINLRPFFGLFVGRDGKIHYRSLRRHHLPRVRCRSTLVRRPMVRWPEIRK